MKLDQKGFGAIEGLLILIVVLIVGFGGYYVLTQNSDDEQKETSTNETSQSDENDTASTSGDRVEIEALGVAIDDPEGIGLTVTEKEIIVPGFDGPDTTSILYGITTDDDVFMGDCGFSVSISELDDDQVVSNLENPESFVAKNTVEVGDGHFYLGLGDNFQASCYGPETDKYELQQAYEDSVRAYVRANIEEI